MPPHRCESASPNGRHVAWPEESCYDRRAVLRYDRRTVLRGSRPKVRPQPDGFHDGSRSPGSLISCSRADGLDVGRRGNLDLAGRPRMAGTISHSLRNATHSLGWNTDQAGCRQRTVESDAFVKPPQRTQEQPTSLVPHSARPRNTARTQDVDVHSLDDLSTALEDLDQIAAPLPRRPVRVRGVFTACLAALLVGGLLTVASTWQYRSVAIIRVAGAEHPDRFPILRSELASRAEQALGPPVATGASRTNWVVDAPESNMLRLVLTSDDRERGLESVRSVAEAFLVECEAKTRQAAVTPTFAEELLRNTGAKIHDNLSVARAAVDTALARLPEDDPRPENDERMGEWDRSVRAFQTTRDQLRGARQDLAALQSAPQPSYGLVDSDARTEALETDTTLQQDLSELSVTLSELKRLILNVWQKATPRLDELSTATRNLASATASGRTGLRTTDAAEILGEFDDHARAYGALLDQFSKRWSTGFGELRIVDNSPHSAVLIDAHAQIRGMLPGFLLQSELPLAGMDSAARALREKIGNDVRLNGEYSRITRAYRATHEAHRRFAIAAGQIEPVQNFRLDAALRSARGLRRRSQHRIRLLDEQLQSRAARRVREQRVQRTEALSNRVDELRGTLAQTMEELISLAIDLNKSTELTEEFLRAELAADLAKQRATGVENTLSQNDAQLAELEAERRTTAQNVKVQLVSCRSDNRPVNLEERLRLGGFAAAMTFFIVAGCQWWFYRRV